MRVESEKYSKIKRLCFSENRCLEIMENQKVKKICVNPRNLSSFIKQEKLVSFQPNMKAATYFADTS